MRGNRKRHKWAPPPPAGARSSGDGAPGGRRSHHAQVWYAHRMAHAFEVGETAPVPEAVRASCLKVLRHTDANEI